MLWGVTFPLISEAVTGEKITVNAPFFNFFVVAFGLPLILLMGVGPRDRLAPRVAAEPAAPRSASRSPSARASGLGLLVLGYGEPSAGAAAYSLSVFVAVAIVLEFARGTSARKALAGGSWPGAFVSLVNRNRRRYGGYIAHLAVVIFVIGATGATAYSTVHEAVLAPGPDDAGPQLHAAVRRRHAHTGANFEERSAVVRVSKDGKSLGTLEPGQRAYPAEGQTSNEVVDPHRLAQRRGPVPDPRRGARPTAP